MALHLRARAPHTQIFGAELECLAVVECDSQRLAVLAQPQLRRPGGRCAVAHAVVPSTFRKRWKKPPIRKCPQTQEQQSHSSTAGAAPPSIETLSDVRGCALPSRAAMMLARIPATLAPMRPTAIAAFAFAAATVVVASAEHGEISSRRASERKSFTDSEITEGFLKPAFGAELHLAGAANRIRKFDGPVRVHVDSRAVPDRRAEVAEVVADIGTRIQHLDIAMVESAAEANVVVTLVRDRDLPRAINRIYG